MHALRIFLLLIVALIGAVNFSPNAQAQNTPTDLTDEMTLEQVRKTHKIFVSLTVIYTNKDMYTPASEGKLICKNPTLFAGIAHRADDRLPESGSLSVSYTHLEVGSFDAFSRLSYINLIFDDKANSTTDNIDKKIYSLSFTSLHAVRNPVPIEAQTTDPQDSVAVQQPVGVPVDNWKEWTLGEFKEIANDCGVVLEFINPNAVATKPATRSKNKN